MLPKVYQEGEDGPGGFTIENVLNKDDNALPFGLFKPEMEGKLTWICDYGPEKDIVSVFCMDFGDHPEKEVRLLTDLDEAKFFRSELINDGWQKLVPPRIEFTMTGSDGKKRPLGRKQKRQLVKGEPKPSKD